jgi:hypothetical protein
VPLTPNLVCALRFPIRQYENLSFSYLIQYKRSDRKIFSFINTSQKSVTKVSEKDWLPGNFSTPPTTIDILRACGLSGFLLCNIYSKEGYWSKMGNRRFMHHNNEGELESYGMRAHAGTFTANPNF